MLNNVNSLGNASVEMELIELLAKLRNLTDAFNTKSPVSIAVMKFDDRST